jgi:hypothetical protein
MPRESVTVAPSSRSELRSPEASWRSSGGPGPAPLSRKRGNCRLGLNPSPRQHLLRKGPDRPARRRLGLRCHESSEPPTLRQLPCTKRASRRFRRTSFDRRPTSFAPCSRTTPMRRSCTNVFSSISTSAIGRAGPSARQPQVASRKSFTLPRSHSMPANTLRRLGTLAKLSETSRSTITRITCAPSSLRCAANFQRRCRACCARSSSIRRIADSPGRIPTWNPFAATKGFVRFLTLPLRLPVRKDGEAPRVRAARTRYNTQGRVTNRARDRYEGPGSRSESTTGASPLRFSDV